MVPVASHALIVGFVRSLCVLLFALGAQPLFAGSGAEPTSETHQGWVSEAEALVAQLLDVSRAAGELERKTDAAASTAEELRDYERMIGELASSYLQRLALRQKADRILWRLWLTTGMAPLSEGQDESVSASLSRNASAYRQYVSQHANLTEEQLHRLGLANAVESFGSPWWYMTMKYLTKKASLEFECIIMIHVFPHRFLIEDPLSSDSYTRFSAALSKWLNANKERMIWDSRARRFRPRDGTYVGTGELSRTLLEPERNWGQPGTEKGLSEENVTGTKSGEHGESKQ